MVDAVSSGWPGRDGCRGNALDWWPRAVATGIAGLLSASPVAAEVCDKIAGEKWTSGDGALWLLVSERFPIVPLLVLGVFAAAVVFRARGLGLVVSAALFALALFESVILLEDDYVLDFAASEGCFSLQRTLASVVLVLLLAGVSLFVSLRLLPRKPLK